MTTKPKAKRFRIRPSTGTPTQAGEAPASAAARDPSAHTSDGFGSEPFKTARGEAPSKPAPSATRAPKAPSSPKPTAAGVDAAAQDRSISDEIDAIRKEGLTGRQLRMSRRLAHRHGLAPTSDFDAVRQLRNAGIDPFERANILELVVAEPGESGAKDADRAASVPQVINAAQSRAVSTETVDPAVIRAREITEIHRDIARRRRRSIRMLILRLCMFVLLPTLVSGYYWFFIATPMYATTSEFVIQQADGQSGGMGGLLSGTGLATSQDSITVQSYLQSREAMLRLNEDLGFKAHFSDPEIDWVRRLPANASNEDAYATFRKHVKVGYDPTEGIVRMEVSAADPALSAAFSKALIGYAEEQVDNLTQRLREDQMVGAREAFAEAEAKMVAAQRRVLELQEKLGVLDPVSETSSVMGQVSNFEIQLGEKRLQLRQLLDNPQPNQARVSGVEGDIARLESLIADLRAQLTTRVSGVESLAQVSSQLRMAEVDLETRTLMMQETLNSLESSRAEANRQVRYLSLGVNPVPPDEASYPRALENTALALLVFSGIYLLVSLTVSILREQVSS